MLRWILPLLFLLMFVGNPLTARGEFFLHDGDVYAINGDSITHFSVYARMIENYVLTRFPDWQVRFYNVGWGGDTANNIARFKRDVLPLKPTAFSDMMGMNDGGYSPIHPVKVQAYTDAYRQIIPVLCKENPNIRIALISSVPCEAIGPYASADGAYVQTLLYLSRVKGKLAKEYGVRFIDLYTAYSQAMGFGKVVYPDCILSEDGIHPTSIGQTIIGMIVLEGMGATPELAEVQLEVQSRDAKVARQRRCNVKDLAVSDEGVVTFRRLSNLPCPIEATTEKARRFLELLNFSDRINRDVLRVEGLSQPAYELRINNVPIATYSSEEWKNGVNISEPMKGPLWDQALAVMQATQERQLAHFIQWQKVFLKNGPFVTEYDLSDTEGRAFYDAQLTLLIQRQHTLAQPKWTDFSLVPVPAQDPVLPTPITNAQGKNTVLNPAAHAPVDWTQAGTKTLDLRKVANRGFSDPVAFDGQGGWSDQGPKNDLSPLPHGKQILAGIPADVIDPASNQGRSMVVLSRRNSLGVAPEVRIDVGFKAKDFAILNSAAWIDESQPPVKVVLTYDDGQTTEMELLPRVHLLDWWGLPHPLPAGLCAWSGKNTTWDIRITWALLPNPQPDKIVRNITLSVPEDSFMIYGLMGITALE